MEDWATFCRYFQIHFLGTKCLCTDLKITKILSWRPKWNTQNREVLIHQKDALTHWGRVTHICVSKLNTTASDNGLSPDRRQAIIWINAEKLLIGPLGTNFSEILVGILTFSFKKMHLKRSSAKQRPFCLGLNELTGCFSQGQKEKIWHVFWGVFVS